jgi:hypothetical protein
MEKFSDALRKVHGFYEKFDIALAAASAVDFRDVGDLLRYQFHERIERIVGSLGKSIFLPHRDIDWVSWKPQKIWDVACNIVVPNSDLLILDGGIPSADVGLMLGSALANRIPFICFYERDRKGNLRDIERYLDPDYVTRIEFDTEKEGLEKLEVTLSNHYGL